MSTISLLWDLPSIWIALLNARKGLSLSLKIIIFAWSPPAIFSKRHSSHSSSPINRRKRRFSATVHGKKRKTKPFFTKAGKVSAKAGTLMLHIRHLTNRMNRSIQIGPRYLVHSYCPTKAPSSKVFLKGRVPSKGKIKLFRKSQINSRPNCQPSRSTNHKMNRCERASCDLREGCWTSSLTTTLDH